MAIGKWSENGKIWEEDQTLLENSEIRQLTRERKKRGRTDQSTFHQDRGGCSQ